MVLSKVSELKIIDSVIFEQTESILDLPKSKGATLAGLDGILAGSISSLLVYTLVS